MKNVIKREELRNFEVFSIINKRRRNVLKFIQLFQDISFFIKGSSTFVLFIHIKI